MMHRLVIVGVILSLAILACGVNISLTDVPTASPEAPESGHEVVEDIHVPAASSGPSRLTISFGGGSLRLGPGAAGLVDGTATYDVASLKPEVITKGSEVEVKQRDVFGLVEPRNVKNSWDFTLGAMPLDLSVNAGAYQGAFEFGGLALTSLTVKDGAAQVDLSFSQPNKSEMTVFRYETGASQVSMRGLANANFTTMSMTSGAGQYTLDFSGDLKRDATITISSGLSELTLIIPDGVPATVTAETGLSDISAGASWSKDGNRYTQSGTGPGLTIIIKGGAGKLTLTH
ncbi:MAG TPA: toast rack family protein [Anaerolineales bacterium]